MDMNSIKQTSVIESDHEYRIMAMLIPDNECYTQKLALIAMPNLTDECPEIVGHLTVDTGDHRDDIEWIEVAAEHRRKGIGRRLWRAPRSCWGEPFNITPSQRTAKSSQTH